MSGEHAGWKSALVRELGDLQLGRQRSPSTAVGPNQTPYLRVANVFDGFIDYSDVLTMSFSQAERRVFGVQPDDILLNEGQSLELVGRSAIYDGPPDRYCIQNTLVRFRCGENLIPAFAQATFKRWMDTGRFAQIAKQTTSIAHLGAGRFGALVMSLPPVPEQRRIAEVLGAIDEAIRKTEQVIAKLQQMKQGLLHDLLTRGIDENGELRDPERLPENFKDSPLGRLPKIWNAAQLGASGQWVSGGTPRTNDPRFWDGGIPWISASSLKSFWLSRSDRTLTERGVAAGSRLVPAGTVIFVVRGMSLKTEFRVGVSTRELAFGQDCKAIVPAGHLDPHFLGLLLHGSCDKVLRLVDEASHGTGRLPIPPLQAMWIGVPPLVEQRQIVARVSALDIRLARERAELCKLRTLKHGLMDDLLTGKVRVIPEEPAR